MNSDPRAALEAKARAWLIDRHIINVDTKQPYVNDVAELMRLLLSTQADVLEEAAELVETIHPDCNASHMFRMIISNALRAKAQERRP